MIWRKKSFENGVHTGTCFQKRIEGSYVTYIFSTLYALSIILLYFELIKKSKYQYYNKYFVKININK